VGNLLARLPWVVWPALVLALGAAILWFQYPETASDLALSVPDGRVLQGYSRWIAAGIALLGAIWAIERIVTGVRKLAGAQYEANADQIFNRGLASLIFGLALVLVALVVGSLAGVARWLDEVSQSEWIENNFEIHLGLGGIVLIVFADWIGRCWVASASGVARVQREFQVNVYSITFAAAMGVVVFVMIGSSAFAARLAQLQIEASAGADQRLSMERVQFVGARITDINAELLRLRRADSHFRDLLIRQRVVIERNEVDMTAHYQEVTSVIDEIQANITSDDFFPIYSNRPTVFQVEQLRERIDAIYAKTSAETPEWMISGLNGAIARIPKLDETLPAPDATLVEARRRANELNAILSELRRQRQELQGERNCIVASLASYITDVNEDERPVANEEQAPNRPTTLRVLFGQSTCTIPANMAQAEQIIDVVQPLRRTWMSEQLAKRTPIALSIELVVVMGALGALLRLASSRLRQVFVRPAAFDASTEAAARANETTLLTMGLQVVFGMATALALFILLNVTINAASMQIMSDRQEAQNLNPFTMAGLGLLGGFAALNVADWMGKMSRRVLESALEDRDAPSPAPPPAPPPAPQG
jgi:hypothetical protein